MIYLRTTTYRKATIAFLVSTEAKWSYEASFIFRW